MTMMRCLVWRAKVHPTEPLSEDVAVAEGEEEAEEEVVTEVENQISTWLHLAFE